MATAQVLATIYPEQALKDMQRWHNWFDAFVANPAHPVMGVTPKDVIWKRGKIQLYHYRPQTDCVSSIPYLIVPWIGISRPFVLDLLPGQSMIEFLVQRGHDVYMLDWGVVAAEDRHLGFDELVGTIIPKAIDRVLECAGARELTLNGICLGGVMSLTYLALNADAPVKNFVSIVTPVDFNQGGLLKAWIGIDTFPSDLLVEHYGGVPPGLMGVGFKMLRPTNDIAALSGLWVNLDRRDYLPSYQAMHHWANDFVGMPGRFFSQLAKGLYGQNELLKGEFRVKGRRVDLRTIHQPLLAIAASHDHIVPPRAAQGLMHAVSSQDKAYLEVRGGHISVFSGRQAHAVMWPKLDAWVTEHTTVLQATTALHPA